MTREEMGASKQVLAADAQEVLAEIRSEAFAGKTRHEQDLIRAHYHWATSLVDVLAQRIALTEA